MIWRAGGDDVEKINGWLARDFPETPIDFSEVLSFERNVCLCEGEGGAVFVWRGPGIYEVHCFFEQRGAAVREISAAILAIIKRDHGAKMVRAAIPDASPKVKIYVRWLGFESVDHAVFPHGPCEIFTWKGLSCHL